jgi:copper chaperone
MSTIATHDFMLDNIHCEACARRVTKAVAKVDANAAVEVDVGRGAVRVGNASASRAALAEALAAAGYPAKA